MKDIMQLKMVILVPLLVLLMSCDSIVIHPIDQKDIFRIKAGQSFTPEVDGYFFSDYYVKEVIDAKVRE